MPPPPPSPAPWPPGFGQTGYQDPDDDDSEGGPEPAAIVWLVVLLIKVGGMLVLDLLVRRQVKRAPDVPASEITGSGVDKGESVAIGMPIS